MSEQRDTGAALQGTRILVVEDEYYIADDLQRALKGAGAEIVGPCGSVQPSLDAIAKGGFDCAVIDLSLHGESAEPIADRLESTGYPFAIATGYGSGAVPEQHKHVPRIEKPFDDAALLKIIEQLVRR